MSEYLQMDAANFKPSLPPTGVTVEYKPEPFHNERAERGRLEDVTLGILMAVDTVMRFRDVPAQDLQYRVDDLVRDIAAQGLAAEPVRSSREDRGDVLGLSRLSAALTYGLMHPDSAPYSLGGYGTPAGGRNVFGDIAVSQGYSYDSPLGPHAVGDAHWYKKTIQMVATAHNQLHVGVYSSGHQHIGWEALRTEFERPEFRREFTDKTGLRISEEQPVVIPELSRAVYDYRGDVVPSKVALPGVYKYLQDCGLDHEPFVIAEPTKYGCSAWSSVMDRASGLGALLKLSGTSVDRKGNNVKFETDDDFNTLSATQEDGSPAALGSMNFSFKPIARDRREDRVSWRELRQDENVIQRTQLADAARKISDVVLGVHSLLVASSESRS